jgi:ABC-type antimicrobial peptide transport system permease subunit
MQHLLEEQLRAQFGGGGKEQLEQLRDVFVQVNGVVSVIVGFSAVIAAVGVVNALALGVLQRRRELGLLRVLGLTGAQVRRMIITEAVQMVVAAVVTGLVLGTVYGWVGGQTLLGSLGTRPRGRRDRRPGPPGDAGLTDGGPRGRLTRRGVRAPGCPPEGRVVRRHLVPAGVARPARVTRATCGATVKAMYSALLLLRCRDEA